MCQLGVEGWWKEKGRRLTFSGPCLLLIIVVGMRVAVFVVGFMLLEKNPHLMKCLARKNKTKRNKQKSDDHDELPPTNYVTVPGRIKGDGMLLSFSCLFGRIRN